MSLFLSRFRFLRWRLWDRPTPDTRGDEKLASRIQESRYGVRLLRYWWAAEAIRDKARSLTAPPVIVDLGCGRGWMRRFAQHSGDARWLGLDGDTGTPELASAGYDEIVECDFGRRLPIPDGSVDIVVSLHVFEHLQDPAFAMREIHRILKPDGIFLAGTPTMPTPAARVRTLQHRRANASDRPRGNGHVRSLSPADWSSMLAETGFHLEFLTGSHLIRLSRSKLESHRGWIRLNQLWGAMFPSLGSEVYLQARRISAVPASAWRSLVTRLRGESDWVSVCCALLVAGVALLAMHSAAQHSVLEHWAMSQSDEYDHIVVCADLDTVDASHADAFTRLRSDDETHRLITELTRDGRDLHILVESREAGGYLDRFSGIDWRVAGRYQGSTGDYMLLAIEDAHTDRLRDTLDRQ